MPRSNKNCHEQHRTSPELVEFCAIMDPSRLQGILAGGRTLEDDFTLKDQGVKCDSERGGKSLKVVFIAGKGEAAVALEPLSVEPSHLPSESAGNSGSQASSSPQRTSVADVRAAAEAVSFQPNHTPPHGTPFHPAFAFSEMAFTWITLFHFIRSTPYPTQPLPSPPQHISLPC